jgi:hypothetical protein
MGRSTMMPYIILGIITVGMALAAALVLYWDRRDKRDGRKDSKK